MKHIIFMTCSLFFIHILSAMQNNGEITFINKNLPTLSLTFYVTNVQTNTQGQYSHTVKRNAKKKFSFDCCKNLREPIATFFNSTFSQIVLRGIDYSGDTITIQKSGLFIVVTNKHNKTITLSSVINQPNSSGSDSVEN